jgi:hypothetical protein
MSSIIKIDDTYDPLHSLRRELDEYFTGWVLEIEPAGRFDGDQDISRLDTFAQSVGCHAIGDQWRQIDQTQAIEALTEALHVGLAYKVDVMPIDKVEWLIAKLKRWFVDDTRFYTNHSNGWTSLTKATFDRGIAFINHFHIGLLVVEDED